MNIEKIIASLPSKSTAERAKMEENARRLFEQGSDAEQTAARRLLDELYLFKVAEEKAHKAILSAMPFTSRVVLAFRKQPASLVQETAIRALLRFPKSNEAELSSVCGWEASTWKRHFSEMAKARGVDLWPVDPNGRQSKEFYFDLLVSSDPAGVRFEMRPEAALAFIELGIASRPRQHSE